jgi:type IX secretion system PorP/SprF family membrane protein
VKRQIYKSFALALVCLSFPLLSVAQDIHYSNFGFSPLNMNPALTGVFNGEYRGTANYRNQWNGVPVNYTTFSGSMDMKMASKQDIPPFRIGAFLSHDKAGWSKLTNTALYISGAYLRPLTTRDFVSGGISIGLNQRSFKTGDLTWDDQYANKRFDPNIISQDASTFDQTIFYPDISAGVNYHRQAPRNRSAFDAGFGYFHINNPSRSFKDGEPAVKCAPRYSLYAATNLKVSDFFDILLDGSAQFQGPHRELLGSLGGRLYLVDKHTKQIALQAGITLRNGDAVSPHVGIIYNRWKVAVNFDSNFSQFKTASNRLGGPELNLIYIFAKVRPANYCTLCPTYL